jgi:hypothetical protein
MSWGEIEQIASVEYFFLRRKVTTTKLEITPSTTVHELLSSYPELEDTLIGLAPPFKKLKNPFLRRSVAKVANLKHVASVGNLPLDELINTIREEIGQPARPASYEDEDYFTSKPDWFSAEKVSVSLVEGEAGDIDKMTVVAVLSKAKNLKNGEIIELITTFLPAPGIDRMKAKGYSVWTTKSDDSTIRTYFMKN